jgi:hypothetical protein
VTRDACDVHEIHYPNPLSKIHLTEHFDSRSGTSGGRNSDDQRAALRRQQDYLHCHLMALSGPHPRFQVGLRRLNLTRTFESDPNICDHTRCLAGPGDDRPPDADLSQRGWPGHHGQGAVGSKGRAGKAAGGAEGPPPRGAVCVRSRKQR